MIYGVSPFIQEKEVTEYCFNQCKKIMVGAVVDPELGPLCPCKEETCEFEEKHSDVIGILERESICIRKLKSIRKEGEDVPYNRSNNGYSAKGQ